MDTQSTEKTTAPRVAAIIVAAGSSRRMQGVNKIWARLGGQSVCARTVSIFAAALVEHIILVVAPEAIAEAQQLCQAQRWQRARVIPGGERRRDSVLAGLAALVPSAPTYVFIHDGARPFVTPDLLERGLATAEQHGAATAAVPIKDTIKRAGPDGLVIETLDRATLWAVQTPQVFAFDLILRAHRASDPTWDATDDAALVEAIGHPVALFTGLHENIKITTPDDLLLAEAILQGRQAAREEHP